MKKFQRRSRRNIPGVTQVRAAPGGAFLKPPGVDLHAKRGARAPPAGRTPHCKVAVLAASGAEETLRVKGCAVVTGRHRCAEANLVVVRDLSVLHDVAALAASVDTAVSFLYVVALGVDVVTEALLAAASYVPPRVSPTQYLRHARACENKATLVLGSQLGVESLAVPRALRNIASAEGSEIKEVAADGDVAWTSLRDVVQWAVSARRVLNELGPKVLAADGSRLPC